jgi:hypothetical protein
VSVVRWRGGRQGRARTLVALGVLVAGGALSACTGQPGAAAVVDGTAISVADVQTATRELTPLYQGVTPTAVLQVLINEKVALAFASAQGVGVSPTQAADGLSGIAAQAPGAPKQTYSAPSITVERYLLATQALQGLASSATILPELQTKISAQKVEVSPRFGVLGDGNTIAEATHPWIVAQKVG